MELKKIERLDVSCCIEPFISHIIHNSCLISITINRIFHIFVIYYHIVILTSKEVYMAVTYKKLFHLLIDRGIPTTELTEKAGFSANILTRLRRDQYVSLDSIEKICFALDCKVDDILDFVPVEKENKNG